MLLTFFSFEEVLPRTGLNLLITVLYSISTAILPCIFLILVSHISKTLLGCCQCLVVTCMLWVCQIPSLTSCNSSIITFQWASGFLGGAQVLFKCHGMYTTVLGANLASRFKKFVFCLFFGQNVLPCASQELDFWLEEPIGAFDKLLRADSQHLITIESWLSTSDELLRADSHFHPWLWQQVYRQINSSK